MLVDLSLRQWGLGFRYLATSLGLRRGSFGLGEVSGVEGGMDCVVRIGNEFEALPLLRVKVLVQMGCLGDIVSRAGSQRFVKEDVVWVGVVLDL